MSCCGYRLLVSLKMQRTAKFKPQAFNAASDDTLSVTLRVSPTAETCLSLRYIYSLFWLAKAGHTVQ